MPTELTKLNEVLMKKTVSLTFVPNGVQYSQKKPYCIGRDNKGKMLLLQVTKQHVDTIKATDYERAIKAKPIEVVRVAEADQKSSYLVTAEAKETTHFKAVDVDDLPTLNILSTTKILQPKKGKMIHYLHVVQRGCKAPVPVWRKKDTKKDGQEQVYCHYGPRSFDIKVPITIYANIRFVNSNKFALGQPMMRGKNYVLTNMELKFHEPSNSEGLWVIWSTALTDIIACDDAKTLTPALIDMFTAKHSSGRDSDSDDESDSDAKPAIVKTKSKSKADDSDSDAKPIKVKTKTKAKAEYHDYYAKPVKVKTKTKADDSDSDAKPVKVKTKKPKANDSDSNGRGRQMG